MRETTAPENPAVFITSIKISLEGSQDRVTVEYNRTECSATSWKVPPNQTFSTLSSISASLLTPTRAKTLTWNMHSSDEAEHALLPHPPLSAHDRPSWSTGNHDLYDPRSTIHPSPAMHAMGVISTYQWSAAALQTRNLACARHFKDPKPSVAVHGLGRAMDLFTLLSRWLAENAFLSHARLLKRQI